MSHFEIANLKRNPSWIPSIAVWHHSEWLRTQEGKSLHETNEALADRKLPQRQRALERHITSEPLPTTFVAHTEGVPIGTVSLVFYQFSKSQWPAEWLTNLYVVPQHRNRGVAGALLDKAIQHASSCDLSRIMLYTSDQVAFYRKRQWRYLDKGIVQGQRVVIMDYRLQ